MPSFTDSLAFEIAVTQAELDTLEERRKKLKKKLRSLSQFLSELEPSNTPKETPNDQEV